MRAAVDRHGRGRLRGRVDARHRRPGRGERGRPLLPLPLEAGPAPGVPRRGLRRDAGPPRPAPGRRRTDARGPARRGGQHAHRRPACTTASPGGRPTSPSASTPASTRPSGPRSTPSAAVCSRSSSRRGRRGRGDRGVHRGHAARGGPRHRHAVHVAVRLVRRYAAADGRADHHLPGVRAGHRRRGRRRWSRSQVAASSRLTPPEQHRGGVVAATARSVPVSIRLMAWTHSTRSAPPLRPVIDRPHSSTSSIRSNSTASPSASSPRATARSHHAVDEGPGRLVQLGLLHLGVHGVGLGVDGERGDGHPLVHQLQRAVEHGVDLVDGRVPPGHGPGVGAEGDVDGVAVGVLVQRELRREVVVHGGRRDLGVAGDLAGGHAVVAPVGEGVEGGLEDAPAGLVAVGVARPARSSSRPGQTARRTRLPTLPPLRRPSPSARPRASGPSMVAASLRSPLRRRLAPPDNPSRRSGRRRASRHRCRDATSPALRSIGHVALPHRAGRRPALRQRGEVPPLRHRALRRAPSAATGTAATRRLQFLMRRHLGADGLAWAEPRLDAPRRADGRPDRRAGRGDRPQPARASSATTAGAATSARW